jgi:hypothetical protein
LDQSAGSKSVNHNDHSCLAPGWGFPELGSEEPSVVG